MILEKKFDLDKIIPKINPPSPEGADIQVDYIFRALIVAFPFFINQTREIMFITGKDLLLGIAALLAGLCCVCRFVLTDKLRIRFGNRIRMVEAAAAVAVIVLFAVQLALRNDEISHTFLYIVCIVLALSSAFAGVANRYYLQLFAGVCTVFYISSFRFLTRNIATIVKAERLLGAPGLFIPFLMLGILVGGILYLTEENSKVEKYYLFYTSAGMILFFLYGDSRAFWTLFLVIAGLYFVGDGSARFFKKSLILTFLYAFCASNTPLLSYFKLPGLNRSYNLEPSIYIDIAMAIAGLFFTRYFEMTAKEDFKDKDCKILMKWYGRIIAFTPAVFLLIYFWQLFYPVLKKPLKKRKWSKAVNAINQVVEGQGGEYWHLTNVYKIVGTMIVLALIAILAYELYKRYKECTDSSIRRGYLMIPVLFAVLGLFYPASSTYLPFYAIFSGLAFTGGGKAGEIAPVGIKDSEEGIYIPKLDTRVRVFTALAASIIAAIMMVLVIVGIYRIMMPADSSTGIGSLVQIAIGKTEN